MQGLCLKSGAVPNRTYRTWGLPIYFLKLHETASTGPGIKRCPLTSSLHRM